MCLAQDLTHSVTLIRKDVYISKSLEASVYNRNVYADEKAILLTYNPTPQATGLEYLNYLITRLSFMRAAF